MVVCDRGINARVDKSLAVAMAGGQAMVLANVVAGTLDADFHSVPTIHVDHGGRRGDQGVCGRRQPDRPSWRRR